MESCYAIAAEGTMLKKLYNNRFKKFNIDVISPEEGDWPKVRYFIEAAKQNKITPDVKHEFGIFVSDHIKEIQHGADGKVHVILGCTELPLLVDEETRELISFEDPLECALSYLKRTLQ